jgi:hypothetical protein
MTQARTTRKGGSFKSVAKTAGKVLAGAALAMMLANVGKAAVGAYRFSKLLEDVPEIPAKYHFRNLAGNGIKKSSMKKRTSKK